MSFTEAELHLKGIQYLITLSSFFLHVHSPNSALYTAKVPTYMKNHDITKIGCFYKNYIESHRKSAADALGYCLGNKKRQLLLACATKLGYP